MTAKKKIPDKLPPQEAHLKDFFDMIVPYVVKFNVDHYIVGDSYRCVWALREYAPVTTDKAI